MILSFIPDIQADNADCCWDNPDFISDNPDYYWDIPDIQADNPGLIERVSQGRLHFVRSECNRQGAVIILIAFDIH